MYRSLPGCPYSEGALIVRKAVFSKPLSYIMPIHRACAPQPRRDCRQQPGVFSRLSDVQFILPKENFRILTTHH
jgi:hypothetical protein